MVGSATPKPVNILDRFWNSAHAYAVASAVPKVDPGMSNTAWQNGRRAVGKVGIAEALSIDVDGKRDARQRRI